MELQGTALVMIILFIACVESGIVETPVFDEPTPQYEFQYMIHNSDTGDIKDQFEHRYGDYVTGRYSLIEPDGFRRIVDYNADPYLGFTAEVRREQSTD